VDIVITHGPPKDILDACDDGKTRYAGCDKLRESVAAARPRLYYYGHNHEGTGVTRVACRANPRGPGRRHAAPRPSRRSACSGSPTSSSSKACGFDVVDGGIIDGIVEGHQYVITDAKQIHDGTRLCKIRYGTSHF